MAKANGETITAEIIGDEATGLVLVITAESEGMDATAEAEAQPEDNEPAKNPARKGKGKKGAASMEDADK